MKTNKNRKMFLATAGIVTLLASCAGTSGTSDEDQHAELGILSAEGSAGYEFLTSIGEEVSEEHPEYSYEYTFVNTKVRPQIEQRWRAGDAPDSDYFVFNAQVPSTYDFVDNLVELTPYLEEEIAEGVTWGETFLDATEPFTNLDGEIYGVPTDSHLIALYYNKKLFDDHGLTPPKTWEELLEVSAALSSENVEPIALTGVYEPYMGFWIDNLFQREVGYEKAHEAAYTGDYDDDGFLRAAMKLQELRDQEAFMSGFEGVDFTAAQMEFFQGNAGMILMGTWLTSEMADSIPEDFELGVVGFPEIPGGDGSPTAQLAHTNIMTINKDTEALDAVLAYARAVTSEEAQTVRAKEYNSVPSVENAPAPDVPGLQELLDNTDEMNLRYFGLEFSPDRNEAYYHEVAKFFMGQYDAEEFISSLAKTMEAFAE